MNHLNKYYKKLGISPTRDESVIKKAYRKKALKYHPDRNPSPTAQEEFIKLTEAYEILIGLQSSPQPQKSQPKTAEEVRAEKIKKAQERYHKMRNTEQKKDEAYFNKITTGLTWKFFKILAIYTAVFSILLTADFFLTGEKKAIPKIETYGYLPKVLELEGELFQIPREEYWIGYFPPIQLKYSYFFKDLKSVEVLDFHPDIYTMQRPSDRRNKYRLFEQFEATEFHSYASVYYLFPYFQIMLFLPLFIFWYKKPNINFVLGRLFSLYVIFPVALILSIFNGRLLSLFGLL
ncbi:J domain-containing protein [Crocinitomix algicola]|uniref:J domain-containing protein n=1 Tax=Crocinitomix algicola TaxID=1740263 RepID=UPI00082EB058|nr:J domain-containing protein [Crocinitomix algicola]